LSVISCQLLVICMCIFCQIIKKEIKAEIVFEDEEIIVIKDINPKASVHLLLIPKRHIESLITLEKKDASLLQEIVFRAKLLAEELGFASSGYKLILNSGQGAGQLVPHLHFHLLSGSEIRDFAI